MVTLHGGPVRLRPVRATPSYCHDGDSIEWCHANCNVVVMSQACLDCTQVEWSETSPTMSGEEIVMESGSPSPLSPEPGSESHNSTPDISSSESAFVRSAARKSLGNGLSMQNWFYAQEKVMEQQQYKVSLVSFYCRVISLLHRAVNRFIRVKYYSVFCLVNYFMLHVDLLWLLFYCWRTLWCSSVVSEKSEKKFKLLHFYIVYFVVICVWSYVMYYLFRVSQMQLVTILRLVYATTVCRWLSQFRQFCLGECFSVYRVWTSLPRAFVTSEPRAIVTGLGLVTLTVNSV